MSGETISMIKLKQIFLHRRNGMALEAIAKAMVTSRNTVKKYIRLSQLKGLSIEELALMEDYQLEQIFAEPVVTSKSRYENLEGLFNWMELELKRTGVTRWILWGEYKARYPDGYAYTQFCEYYREWLEQRDATMHLEHASGDKLYIDFAGKKLHLINPEDGIITKVEVYIAVLGYSQLAYVEAVYSQGKDDFLHATSNALNYFGGVPKALITDNLKAAVTAADNYEPEINESFLDFGNHYQTTIYPTRSRKPKDKAIVENTVNIIYRRIYEPLRNLHFLGLSELNVAIRQFLEQHNIEPLQKENVSRRKKFELSEAKCLFPLPAEAFQLKKYKVAKVMKNCHVQLEKHYYSIPYRFIGKEVKIVYSRDHVHIFYKAERIAYHIRSYQPYTYTTIADHLPSTHQFVNDWNPEKFLSWADSIAPQVRAYLEEILQQRAYPEQAYKSCLGILTLAKKTGKERLIKAVERATFYQIYNYKTIKKILNGGLEMLFDQEIEEPERTLPDHENIRGKNQFQ